jgi:hypothetical protein
MKKHLDQQFFYNELSGVFISTIILVIWGVSSPVESANTANLDVHLQPAGKDTFISQCYRLMGMDVTSSTTDSLTGIVTGNDNDVYSFHEEGYHVLS